MGSNHDGERDEAKTAKRWRELGIIGRTFPLFARRAVLKAALTEAGRWEWLQKV